LAGMRRQQREKSKPLKNWFLLSSTQHKMIDVLLIKPSLLRTNPLRLKLAFIEIALLGIAIGKFGVIMGFTPLAGPLMLLIVVVVSLMNRELFNDWTLIETFTALEFLIGREFRFLNWKMARPSPLIWLALLLILLLPTAAGRVLLDLAGGLMLAALVLPFLLTGLGWLGWRVLQSRMVTCQACGMRTLSSSGQCPVCGAGLSDTTGSASFKSDASMSTPASDATIDITAEDAGSDG